MADFQDLTKDLDDNAKKQLLDYLISGLNVESKKSLQEELKKNSEVKEVKPKQDELCTYDDRKLPSLPKFSGTNAKGETSYKRWKYEVNQLIQSGCPEFKLKRAMEKSLFGTASDTIMYIDGDSTVAAILQKFDVLYMATDDDQSALAQFYSATQNKDEALPAWFTRLECMLNVDCLSLPQTEKDKMLRSRFWKGLACETTKNALRHKYDTGSSVMELLQAARQITEEVKKNTAAQCHVNQFASSSSQQDMLAKLMDKMSTLQTRLDEWDSRMKNNTPQASQKFQANSFKGRCFKCKMYGHKASECKNTFKSANLNSNVPVQGGHGAQKGNPPQTKQH